MPINQEFVFEYLQQFDFNKLFVEIGWDHSTANTITFEINENTYTLEPVVEKRNVQVLICKSVDGIPSSIDQKKIESRVRKIFYEHLIIFIDNEQTTQVWQWVHRKPGQPAQVRSYRFEKGQTYEFLIQKLRSIQINIKDEEELRLLDVTESLRDAFDKDKITKQFYSQFQKQQKIFQGFIENISDGEHAHWYSAVMLNRLMFIYFIQKKGFLNDDVSYLKNNLIESKKRFGENKYYTFYRNFLRRLFHEGLDQQGQVLKVL